MTAKKIEKTLRDALAKDERTQKQLAADAGIATAQIHHFRNETRSLSWPSAAKLAAALGLVLVKGDAVK